MSKVLLVLSTSRSSPKSVRVAFDAAKETQTELLVLFVLDTAIPNQIFDRLLAEGWIGGEPSERLQEAILNEYAEQVQERITNIKQLAQLEHVRVTSLIRKGEFAEQVQKVVQKYDVATLILTRRRRSKLSRFIFGSAVTKLKSSLPCKVIIVDEE